MKKRLWQIHSVLGLIAGLGLLVIGLTGSALVFRNEIDALAAPDIMRVEPTAAGRLPWKDLAAAAERAWPDHDITGFGPRTDPGLADLVYLKKKGGDEFQAGTLNPYTGTALSGPLTPEKTFTGLLLELHYTWFADHTGMLITGIFGVLLCLLGVTGVWIYRGFWKTIFTLRWKRGARILFSDLHKFTGITSVAFNLLLGFTGAYWNLTHIAMEVLTHVEEPKHESGGFAWNRSLSLDDLTTSATGALPGFKTCWISFPEKPDEQINLWGRVPGLTFLASDYGSQVAFDQQTGAVKTVVDLRKLHWWMQFTDTFRALHYGTFGGLPIKLLWSLLALAPGILAVTGFLIWQRRRASRRRPATRIPVAAPAAEAPAN